MWLMHWPTSSSVSQGSKGPSGLWWASPPSCSRRRPWTRRRQRRRGRGRRLSVHGGPRGLVSPHPHLHVVTTSSLKSSIPDNNISVCVCDVMWCKCIKVIYILYIYRESTLLWNNIKSCLVTFCEAWAKWKVKGRQGKVFRGHYISLSEHEGNTT